MDTDLPNSGGTAILRLGSARRDDLARATGLDASAATPVLWSLCLRPDELDRDGVFSDDLVCTYRRLTWDGPPPEELDVEVEWTREDVEDAVRCWARATRDGAPLAASDMVLVPVTRGRAGPAPAVPPVGPPGDESRHLIVNEAEARSFASHSNSHALSTSSPRAQSLGMPNILIQEGMALALLARLRALPLSGEAALWYSEPLPVGVLLTIWCDDPDGGSTWGISKPGSDRPAVVAQITPR